MSLLHSSNRIRPAVQIIAPLRALCVALLYVLLYQRLGTSPQQSPLGLHCHVGTPLCLLVSR